MSRANGRARRSRLRWVAAAATLLLVPACEPPDRPALLPPILPEEAERFLRPDTVRGHRLAHGIGYRYVWSPEGPWAVHLLGVDLSECGVEFAVVPAGGAVDGRTPVSELLSHAPPGTVAGVNGDFFTMEGTPRGTEVSTGGLRASGSRPAFVWDSLDGPWIGDVEVRDGRVVAVDESSEREAVPAAVVSGFPELLDDGRKVDDLQVEERPSFAGVRHPRTAVGYAPDLRRLWIVVVDGRQGSYSAGMSLPELTRLLVSLGATEALNLDGGGSSVMIAGSRTMSRPSADEGERAVANALAIVSDRTGCEGPLARLRR